MYKIPLTYTDYNGTERTEDFYFNLSESELTEMELTTEGGMKARLERIINAKEQTEIAAVFKDIILKSYGEKSDDGRRFIKKKNGERLADAFEETEAYNTIFMMICTNTDAATNFINNVLPNRSNIKTVPATNF